ncbi:MAG: hypothetical protein ACTHJ7_00010 [Candidatus Nitrosocosmicus sp.]
MLLLVIQARSLILHGDSLNVFHHMYSKELGKKVKVRKEVQEQPNEPLEDAFIDKIDEDDNTKLLHLV